MSISEDIQRYRDPLSRHVTFGGRAVGGAEAPTLEGVFQCVLDGTLHPGVVLCHANPASGGNMDMKVMLAIEEALASAGIASLRYNSRGVGLSTGAVSPTPGKVMVAPEGEAEAADVGAALDFLERQEGVDGNRLAVVGHSFGARIVLAYIVRHPDTHLRAAVCIGLPVAWRDLSYLGQWPHPKLFVTGEHDDFCPPDKLAAFTAGLPPPKTNLTLRGTGHFFEGREGDLAGAVLAFLQPIF